MTDPYFRIITSTGAVVPLNGQSGGTGYWEAQPRTTGLGLPPVSVQFDTNAGDGGTFRGRRVGQRDIDIPLNIATFDRATLKVQAQLLATVMSEKFRLQWVDDLEIWGIDVFYVSGGDYIYGEDTIGSYWLNTTVTIRSESPFWELETESSLNSANPPNPLTLSIPNVGSAKSPPIWEISGPTLGFRATSDDGEILDFSGFIDEGEKIFIDVANGTVVDANGANRYAELAASPNFWRVPPGESEATVIMDRSSDAFNTIRGTPRRNHVTNPQVPTNSTGWTTTGFTHNASLDRLQENSSTSLGGWPNVAAICTGLTVGETYVARFRGVIPPVLRGYWKTTYRPARLQMLDSSGEIQTLTISGQAGTVRTPTLTFQATATTMTFRFNPEYGVHSDGSYARTAAWATDFYVGLPGAFFSGSTPDTPDWTYDWEGAASASQSKATPVAPDSSGSAVKLRFKPRNWLVI